MKKIIATVLCFVLALSVAGCGSVPKPGEGESKPLTYTDSEKNEISYNETAGLFSVNGTLYRATGKSYEEAICGEEIKNLALPISDGRTVTAWSPMYEGIIVVLIDGEWQEFIEE